MTTTHGDLSNGVIGHRPEVVNMKPLVIGPEDGKPRPDKKRRLSSDSVDSFTKVNEVTLDDCKEEDDENDDEDDDKLHSQDIDPERLKAFNMFVRLFVDENLDRAVPISKQPKDKVQAIIEACDRQFPEFHHRSRKRIRTYLKSCRRMRRSKDGSGWELVSMRPTPPHLTSAAAETILAEACENEGSNAKRMRMGLEPIAAVTAQTGVTAVTHRSIEASPTAALPLPSSPTPSPTHSRASSCPTEVKNVDTLTRGVVSPMPFRQPHDLPSPIYPANGNRLLRTAVSSVYQPSAHEHNRLTSHPLNTTVQNTPTDLSMKKPAPVPAPKTQQLNPAEVSTIRQLVAGYRESAAFLYRSADELEQLLMQQN